MQPHERYIQSHQEEPFYFYLKSDSLEKDIEWIEQHKIENIRLCGFEPYNIQSIDILSRIRISIKRLAIFLKNADLSGLRQYRDLIELSIGEPSTNVDLSGLEKLESLYFVYSKNASGFETLKSLKSLTLIKVKPFFFNDVLATLFQHLSSFNILSGELPKDFRLIPLSDKLKSLELFNLKIQFDSHSLLNNAVALEILKVEKCKQVQNVELALSRLKSLTYLSLIDSVPLKDTSFVRQLSQLKTLVVLGSSYFVDGNIEALKTLKWVSIDNKRHYNLKYEELPKTI